MNRNSNPITARGKPSLSRTGPNSGTAQLPSGGPRVARHSSRSTTRDPARRAGEAPLRFGHASFAKYVQARIAHSGPGREVDAAVAGECVEGLIFRRQAKQQFSFDLPPPHLEPHGHAGNGHSNESNGCECDAQAKALFQILDLRVAIGEHGREAGFDGLLIQLSPRGSDFGPHGAEVFRDLPIFTGMATCSAGANGSGSGKTPHFEQRREAPPGSTKGSVLVSMGVYDI